MLARVMVIQSWYKKKERTAAPIFSCQSPSFMHTALCADAMEGQTEDETMFEQASTLYGCASLDL
jgi:hypothetical protein